MYRFFVDCIEDFLVLRGDNHAHIAYSLRLRAGEDILLFCGDGFDYRYKIVDIKKNETTVSRLSTEQNLSESNINIHAFVSCIKPDKMSLIYQKLTELGVKSFIPLITEFSQAKKADFNAERYQKICIEACKQCGRSVVPSITSPIHFLNLEQLLGDFDYVIFAYEKAQASLKEQLSALSIEPSKQQIPLFSEQSKGDSACPKIAVIIGPEGGFSTNETQHLMDLGIVPISLGKRILRAETAAIAVVSAILYEFDW